MGNAQYLGTGEKTVFEITKMDCPSEENIIRMKLDGISIIANLDFPNRELTIFYSRESMKSQSPLSE